MVPLGVQNYMDSLSSTMNTTVEMTTLPPEEPPPSFHDRLAALLEFVDIAILTEHPTGKTVCSCVDSLSILKRVHSDHKDDFNTARASNLDVEDPHIAQLLSFPLSFETIGYPHTENQGVAETQSFSSKSPILAIRSKEPVLDALAVKDVLQAAEDVWRAEQQKQDDDSGSSTASRFTYQYSGNSEAHVSDFIATAKDEDRTSAGTRAVTALNEALHTKIYPAIREAFFQTPSNHHVGEDDDGIRLFVYDALVIRYNSTKAAEAAIASGEAVTSAGQPLHRDLGLVSVNIMLNPSDDFEGGGTFFEHQLLNCEQSSIKPLKPQGMGYCLAHSASERHAGAGTTKGVRDILVLFVSAAALENDAIQAPAELLSARLKSCREFCDEIAMNDHHPIETKADWNKAQVSALLCRILHQRLAVTGGPLGNTPNSLMTPGGTNYCDGEAFQYLGTALMEYAGFLLPSDRVVAILEKASECFEVAALVTPCDSRVHNNLGIVLGRIGDTKRELGLEKGHDIYAILRREQQEEAYQEGLNILKRSIAAGCTNDSLLRDLESTTLNYGLFVANQDRFHEAAAILQLIANNWAATTDAGKDAHKLWKYCVDRCRHEDVPE